VLLQRCLNDNDDEVRDRTTFYLRVLQSSPDVMHHFISEDFQVPIINLEKSLLEYQKNPSQTPFDIHSVSLAVQVETPTVGKKTPSVQSKQERFDVVAQNKQTEGESNNNAYTSLLASIPQFANLGPIFKSSKSFELTESETEYVVNVVKHIFNDHIVLQYNCTNTIAEQVLDNVSIRVDSPVKDLKVEAVIPAERLSAGAPGTIFVLLKKSPGSFPSGTIQNTLKFTLKEIDPSTNEPEEGGMEDEYQLETFDLGTNDYMQKAFLTNFEQKWNEVGDEFEVTETYALSSAKSMQDGVNEVIQFLGMQAADRTDKAKPKSTKHILLLAGNYLGGVPVVVEAKMKFAEGQGVAMQMTVRSTSDDISTAIASAI